MAISWLEELHLIDDLETAKQLVRSANLRGYGRARAKSILYEKGIPKELWDEALSEFGETDGAIDAFLRKKLSEGRLTRKPSKSRGRAHPARAQLSRYSRRAAAIGSGL